MHTQGQTACCIPPQQVLKGMLCSPAGRFPLCASGWDVMQPGFSFVAALPAAFGADRLATVVALWRRRGILKVQLHSFILFIHFKACPADEKFSVQVSHMNSLTACPILSVSQLGNDVVDTASRGQQL